MTIPPQTTPAGYKQTEIGVIPEDWDVKSLFSLADYVTVGFVGSMSHLFLDDGVPLLRGTNIQPGRIDFSELKYISKETHKLWKKSSLRAGDIVIVRVGYPGTAAVVSAGLGDLNAASLVVIRINPKVGASEYICYVLNSDWGTREIQNLLVGGAQQVFNIGTASAFKIGIPKRTEEQTAIATVLSDADALIENLEKLIAKKRAVKQGAMQQLLTGKKRLPGFSGEWEVKKLGEISSINTGKKDVNEGSISGIYPFFTCSKKLSYSDSYSFEGEAIMIAGNGEVGHLQYYNGKFEAYQRTYVLQNFTVNTDYLWLQLSANFKKSLGIGTIGSTIPYIKKENIYDFEYLCPIDIKEQTAIAIVLSGMDSEIEKLENKLTKYRQIKIGMMQQLLTGKIRIYEPTN